MNLDIESPQVKAIRQRYKASLKGKSDMVNDYLVLLIEPSGTSDDKLHNIYLELHKLAGSSGMYGYQDISDLAR
jgi:HPt (histidine-containing phosphotransfer) domain-containing protein